MSKYLIKLNELNDKNKYIKDNIQAIKECIYNITNLKESITWSGPSKNKFILKYNEYLDYLNKMVINLESCLKVSKKYQENYTEGYNEIKSDFKKLREDVENKWKEKIKNIQ